MAVYEYYNYESILRQLSKITVINKHAPIYYLYVNKWIL